MKNHALHTVSTAKTKCPSLRLDCSGMCANNTSIPTKHINRLNTTNNKITHLPKSCACARLKMWLLLVCHNFCKVNAKYSQTDTFQANNNWVAHIQSVNMASKINNTAVMHKLAKKYGLCKMALRQWEYFNMALPQTPPNPL